MAWNDTKNEQDLISNTDWNDHVSVTMQTSGAFWAHSSNSNIHFTKSSIDTVGTITTGTWNATPISQSYIKSGSQYYQGYLHSANSNIHLTPSQKSDLTDGGDSTLHYHASDRNLSNATGILSISHGGTNNSSYTSDKFVIYDGLKLTSSSYDGSSFASVSHTHDDRYYTETESDSNFFPSSLGHSHINNTSNPHNVTYSQVGAIQDANDVIKDTHIDWGTGANQVSLDDVPDGTSYARLTATQKTDLTDGGDTTLHYHASDRNLNNATGTLSVSHGGTNNSSYTTDKFLIYDGSKITSSTYDNSSFATASHTHSASDITTGTLVHERGGLEADVSAYNGLVKIAGGATSYVTDNSSNWNTAYTHSQTTTGNPHQISVSDLSDSNISSPKSGQVLTYAADLSNSTWQNVLPPMTFSTPTVALKGNRFIRLARFETGSGKKCYLWQASASDINGNSVYDLKVQLLSGSTVIYTTSSNTIQQGYPLAETSGKITIRLAYSGSTISDTDDVQGLGFMQVSVY